MGHLQKLCSKIEGSQFYNMDVLLLLGWIEIAKYIHTVKVVIDDIVSAIACLERRGRKIHLS